MSMVETVQEHLDAHTEELARRDKAAGFFGHRTPTAKFYQDLVYGGPTEAMVKPFFRNLANEINLLWRILINSR